jgi:hypothetical protein
VHDTPALETVRRRLTTDSEAGNRAHIVKRPTALAKRGIEQTHAGQHCTHLWRGGASDIPYFDHSDHPRWFDCASCFQV